MERIKKCNLRKRYCKQNKSNILSYEKSLSIKSNEMNKKELEILKNGDIGQGENLVEAKMRREQAKLLESKGSN